ncbi:MAG: insulinase family protein [Bacteroidota bacterium]
MKKQFFVLVLSIAYSAFSFAQKNVEIKQFKLDNGLTVILNEDHTRPEVFGLVAVKAGGKNDPKGATGMAHYQEHMLFKGTEEIGTTDWTKEKIHIDNIFKFYDDLGKTIDTAERRKIQMKINEESLNANKYAIPNEFDKIVKSMGGTEMNANTGADRTVYFNAFPPSQIEKWLDLYSHRFMSPVFRGFQSELEVVYEEKNLYSDMFQTQLIESFNKSFFKKHPYGQQTLVGTIDDLKNPSLTKMYEFFKTYYVANNMALVLVGDFDSDKIIPIIKEKFGRLKSGTIPKQEEYKEEDFKGRELVEVKLTPIKIGILGFRTPPNAATDEIAMQVCNRILSNGNQTGLLDKLSLDNKLLAAMILPIQYNDYGSTLVLMIPKIIGQSLEEAEKLVIDEFQKVRKGNFDDWMLEAMKKELYNEYQQKMESYENKAVMIGEAFGQNRNMDDFANFSSKLNKISKEDIVRVANAYYGDNYLAFFSKMGFPKKAKIDKPGYKPVISNTTAESKYVQYLKTVPSYNFTPRFVDFTKDMNEQTITSGHKLYYVNNPVNDIFSLDIKYGIGDFKMPSLKYASQLLNMSGVKDMDVTQFKSEFSKIGCTYNVSSDDSYVIVHLEGIEENLNQALTLVNKLIVEPKLDKSKLKLVIEGEKSDRKMEKSEPDNVADALFAYVKYNNKSEFIDRLTMKQIKSLNTDTLVADFVKSTKFEAQYHYVGTIGAEKANALIKEKLNPSSSVQKSESPIIKPIQEYNKNIIYLVNKKKAAQSKIYLFENATIYDKSQEPFIDAFNLYFGGDFSGLVLQEIREYRSLAYGAGARYSIPQKANQKTMFYGYVATQADKTIEALSVFDTLIRTMPQKVDRMDMIKTYLSESAISSEPNFRDLSQQILKWQLRGFDKDPVAEKIPVYNQMEFNQIYEFYKKNIQNQPMVISIVGDKSRINLNDLKKYGTIIEIKESALFKN